MKPWNHNRQTQWGGKVAEPYLDHNLMPVLLISLFCTKNQLGESELGERELGERELGVLCMFCLASQNPPQP